MAPQDPALASRRTHFEIYLLDVESHHPAAIIPDAIVSSAGNGLQQSLGKAGFTKARLVRSSVRLPGPGRLAVRSAYAFYRIFRRGTVQVFSRFSALSCSVKAAQGLLLVSAWRPESLGNNGPIDIINKQIPRSG